MPPKMSSFECRVVCRLRSFAVGGFWLSSSGTEDSTGFGPVEIHVSFVSPGFTRRSSGFSSEPPPVQGRRKLRARELFPTCLTHSRRSFA